MVDAKERRVSLQDIHKSIILLTNRAERIEGEVISKSFVEAQPLTVMLSSKNNQIIYGRRGTGKTHAIRFLEKEVVESGEMALYLGFRDLGSNGSIYADPSKELPVRASRLMQDILFSIHDSLLEKIYDDIERYKDPAAISAALDAFADASSRTRVVGLATQKIVQTDTEATEKKGGLRLSVGKSIGLGGDVSSAKNRANSSAETFESVGEMQPHLEFGALQAAFKKERN